MVKIDLRVITLDVPAQEVITRDNVTVRVNAVLYFRVFDPEKAVVSVTDYVRATLQIAQTTLRSVLGQSDLDELLSQREEINQRLQQIIDEQTEPWGIKVSIVEVKDVELPQTMQRAMARQAEAEREKRAKIIHADGEFEASQMLAEAAHVIGSRAGHDPAALPADADRDRHRAELDDHLPAADRAVEPDPACRHARRHHVGAAEDAGPRPAAGSGPAGTRRAADLAAARCSRPRRPPVRTTIRRAAGLRGPHAASTGRGAAAPSRRPARPPGRRRASNQALRTEGPRHAG